MPQVSMYEWFIVGCYGMVSWCFILPVAMTAYRWCHWFKIERHIFHEPFPVRMLLAAHFKQVVPMFVPSALLTAVVCATLSIFLRR